MVVTVVVAHRFHFDLRRCSRHLKNNRKISFLVSLSRRKSFFFGKVNHLYFLLLRFFVCVCVCQEKLSSWELSQHLFDYTIAISIIAIFMFILIEIANVSSSSCVSFLTFADNEWKEGNIEVGCTCSRTAVEFL